MDNQDNKKAAGAFARALAESLGEELTKATGIVCPMEVLDIPNLPTQKGTPMHFRLSAEGPLSGDCFIEFSEPQVLELVTQIMKEPIVALTDAHGDMLAKLIVSATKSLAVSRPDEYGQLQFSVDRVAGLAFGGMFVIPLATPEGTPEIQALLYFGGQMLDLLSALAGGQSTAKGEGESSVVAPHNLKLVMDVELNVSLRFGQRQLPLREVLELGSGSVIELDRMADEPVELYLDGKLIARGEAVVVDGNYGLRVTEIPRPIASYLAN
jgi:flagellar motor switch protein FliN/FliY